MNKFMVFEEIKEVTPGGAPPATPPADDGFDDFGYAKVTPPVDDKAPPPPPPPKEEVIEPGTGYGKDPFVVKEPEVPAPPPVPIDLGYELDLKDVATEEAKKLQEFAKTHALPKEAAQALVNLKRSEMKANLQAQEDQKKQAIVDKDRTKASWDKELRTDPTFGGENFAPNLLKVERVMNDFMKETKKELTKRGSMLPPYVMRDLSIMAERLYGTEKLVHGSAMEVDRTVQKESSPLDFYV